MFLEAKCVAQGGFHVLCWNYSWHYCVQLWGSSFLLPSQVSFLVMLDEERCCVQIICVCVCARVFSGFH